jgi:aminoglycoside phosphotransferase (APT) family kinase protein
MTPAQSRSMALSPADSTMQKLVLAVKSRFGSGVKIENVVLPTLGGSNRTTIFDLVEAQGRRRLVARQTTYEGKDSPFIPAASQFHIMKVAADHGVPVPEPVFAFEPQDDLGEGFVTAFVEGETLPNRILGSPEYADILPGLSERCAEVLALLHSIEPTEVDILAATPDSVDPLEAQRRRYDLYQEPHPAVELALRWLERNQPTSRQACFLHGDFRTGNLMVDRTGLRAVLDWECSHLGYRMEDIGWLCTRSWRFGRVNRPVGGFAQRKDFYRAYERASGQKVDAEQVRYWEIFGLVKWTILNIMQAYGHMHEGRRSVAFVACGRNTNLVEYDMLMTLLRRFPDDEL